MKFRRVFAAFLVSVGLLAASSAGTNFQTPPVSNTVLPETDKAVANQWYAIGAKDYQLQFLLKPNLESNLWFTSPDENFFAQKHERLVRMYFTVKNIQKRDITLGSKTFGFTIMSNDSENSEFHGYLLKANGARLSQVLKPNQSIECSIIMPYHESGPFGKLLVEYGQDHSLTYEIPEASVAKQSQFYPQGSTGILKTLELPQGQQSVWIKGFKLSKASKTVTTDKIKGYKPDNGYVYVVYTFVFVNLTQLPNPLGFQYFTPRVIDSTRKEITWNRDILAKDEDVTFGQSVAKGEFVTVRYYFHVKDGLQDSLTFSLTDTTSERTMVFRD